MKRRCLNKAEKSYRNYGARGIKVCEKWLSFQGFYEDMAGSYIEGLSLERLDNNKDYSKENCIWIPVKDQSKNRRTVKRYTFNGETLILTEWAKRLNLNYGTLITRIRDGWSAEKALSTPTIRKGEGVSFDKQRRKWRANYWDARNKKTVLIGRYEKKSEAQAARIIFIKNL